MTQHDPLIAALETAARAPRDPDAVRSAAGRLARALIDGDATRRTRRAAQDYCDIHGATLAEILEV